MLSCEEILDGAAKVGSIDSEQWARILVDVLGLLEKNVYTQFPIPKELPEASGQTPDPPSSPPKPRPSDPSSDETVLQTPAKESAPPSSPPQVAASPALRFAPPHPDAYIPDSQPGLPAALRNTHTQLANTLSTDFPNSPPHTVQRLAELLLYPTAHHRTLPSYLTALTRVLSVSSPASLFPLPTTDPQVPGASRVLIHGAAPAPQPDGERKRDEENLGGALLSPIPWLHRNGTSPAGSPRQRPASRSAGQERDANNHFNGRPSTDADTDADADADAEMLTALATTEEQHGPSRDTGAVTQGELLRRVQQQEEGDGGAGGPLSAQMQTLAPGPGVSADTGSDAAKDPDDDRAEHPEPDTEAPHARGPEPIGMEDTGPQGTGGAGNVGVGQALDMSAAVGRGRDTAAERKEGEVVEMEQVEGAIQQPRGRVEAREEGVDGDGDVDMDAAESASAADVEVDETQPASGDEGGPGTDSS